MQSKCDVARPETFTMDAVKLEFDTNFIGIVALANAFLPYLEEKSKITPSSIVM
jgi:NAD(P)-dependent dehydrogenase (short-subunit alcohol dehydrogenase family)